MTTLAMNAGSDDQHGDAGAWTKTTTAISIGNYGTAAKKDWIPFINGGDAIVAGQVLTTAVLKVVASANKTNTTCKVRIGCEDALDPAAPSDWATLNARTMTTAYLTNDSVPSYSAGTEYSYDVKTAVQEFIDSYGLPASGKIAILVFDNGSTNDAHRNWATDEHATYAAAVLTLEYTVVAPSGQGQVIIWSSE